MGDLKGEKSPVIDLNKKTLEFGDKLEELMANVVAFAEVVRRSDEVRRLDEV